MGERKEKAGIVFFYGTTVPLFSFPADFSFAFSQGPFLVLVVFGRCSVFSGYRRPPQGTTVLRNRAIVPQHRHNSKTFNHIFLHGLTPMVYKCG